MNTKKTKKPEIDIDFFIGGEVQSMVSDLKRKRETHRHEPNYDRNWDIYSDIEDDAGNQYVDYVQEGGGILGIALLGYTYVLEEFGIRFLSMGGTSAGAINTLLLAAAGKPHEKRSIKLIKLLINKDFFEFVDTKDRHLKSFLRNILSGKVKKMKLIWDFFFIIDNILNLKDTHGLNPGTHFEDWLRGELKNFDISNTSQILENMVPDPGTLRQRKNDGLDILKDPIKPKLAFIATDITTQTKVEFPEMADLYWESWQHENPAAFVRASMSIPVFFEPFRVSDIPKGYIDGDDDVAKAKAKAKVISNWRKKALYKGDLPDKVLFVDGGIVSNFPFDLFHRRGAVPRMPTFGVRLGVDRRKLFKYHKLTDLLESIFSTARHMNDLDFVHKNKDEYEHLVKFIDIDGFSWLDLGITPERKRELFIRGAKAAVDFLEEFHWSTYKNVRKQQLEVVKKYQ